MSIVMNKCKGGKRHSWVFVRDKMRKVQRGCFIHFTKSGVYQCRVCELQKYGAPQFPQQPDPVLT